MSKKEGSQRNHIVPDEVLIGKIYYLRGQNDGELRDMVSQFVIPNKSVFGGAKPFAFTEQGGSDVI